ncbi:hypothetical protein PGIGA_G00046070 [Pangasianodon gigas]|uniref:Uncharacterized protein n=1 Tax=Pangasianodon gigas TaxID=30993 RepID=A0ACC5X183_PANGG|nr:hypothetical protein [Pangasianodon gigas]
MCLYGFPPGAHVSSHLPKNLPVDAEHPVTALTNTHSTAFTFPPVRTINTQKSKCSITDETPVQTDCVLADTLLKTLAVSRTGQPACDLMKRSSDNHLQPGEHRYF